MPDCGADAGTSHLEADADVQLPRAKQRLRRPLGGDRLALRDQVQMMRKDLDLARRRCSESPRRGVHEEVDVLDVDTARAIDTHVIRTGRPILIGLRRSDRGTRLPSMAIQIENLDPVAGSPHFRALHGVLDVQATTDSRIPPSQKTTKTLRTIEV